MPSYEAGRRFGVQPVVADGARFCGPRMRIRLGPVVVGVRGLAEGNCCRHLVTRARWRCRFSWIRGARRVLARSARLVGVEARIERIASWRVAVNDTARGGQGRSGRVGVDGTGVRAVARAMARIRFVAVVQAQNSWRTIAGVVERKMGPRDGPASVMVDLFSLNVTSDPVHRHG